MTQTYAIVRTVDQVVDNLILWDGSTPYTPPSGTFTVVVDSPCDIGWVYDAETNTFSPPEP